MVASMQLVICIFGYSFWHTRGKKSGSAKSIQRISDFGTKFLTSGACFEFKSLSFCAKQPELLCNRVAESNLYLVDDGWSWFGGVANIGRGVAAGDGAGRGGRGNALVARLNQCRGGGLLLTQHSATASVARGVAGGGGDCLVVGFLWELLEYRLLIGWW